MKVCLIEDHDLLREMLQAALRDEGFDVTAVSDADGLAEVLAVSSFDAYVIDLNLPGESGLSIARRLKSVYPECFIIMATARERIQDRVRGYQMGADVYMTKPVHIRELAAVLGSHRRRCGHDHNGKAQLTFHLDEDRLVMQSSHGEVRLSPSEARIVRVLALAPDRSLPYWRLFESLGKAATDASKRVLEVHVVNLRKKIIQLGARPPVVQSIKGQGYRLTLPVQVLKTPASRP